MYFLFKLLHKSQPQRVDAVRKLDNQSLLASIAKNDPDDVVRAYAVRRLDNQSLLARIAMNDCVGQVRREAVDRIDDQSLLANIAKHSSDKGSRREAISRLKDQSELINLARDYDDDIATEAYSKIEDKSIRDKLAPKMIPFFINILIDSGPYPGMAYHAEKELTKIGERAIKSLSPILSSERYSEEVKIRVRNILKNIPSPESQKIISSMENADEEAWNSDEFKRLRDIWRAGAKQFWSSGVRSKAVCDSCNNEIWPGGGYLRGSRLDCENCCRRMLDANALKEFRKNPRYFDI